MSEPGASIEGVDDEPLAKEGPGDPDEGRDTSYLDNPFVDPEAMAWLLKPLPQPRRLLPRAVHREPKITETDLHASAEWEQRGFTEVERDVWIEAGLGRFDSLTAKLCRDAGLTPADLTLVVDGRHVAQLMRSGAWSPSAMAAHLRSESA